MPKCDADVVDEFSTIYVVPQNSRHWSLIVSFTLISVSGINAKIIHEDNTYQVTGLKSSWKEFN
jgi:hypothetical protein